MSAAFGVLRQLGFEEALPPPCGGVSAGREDMDVRMLGSGRPFILEIHSARRGMPPPEALREMEAAVARVREGLLLTPQKTQPSDTRSISCVWSSPSHAATGALCLGAHACPEASPCRVAAALRWPACVQRMPRCWRR